MPRIASAIFECFEPAALALITEATLLAHKVRRMVSIECGILWAAQRSIERGDARGTALGTISSGFLEREYASWFREYGGSVNDARIELELGFNGPYVLPHRTPPDQETLSWQQPVSAARLLATIIAWSNFEMIVNAPFRSASIDPRDVRAALLTADGFVPAKGLTNRGTIPDGRTADVRRANELAESVGSWLVTTSMAEYAVSRDAPTRGEAGKSAARKAWREHVRIATAHVESGGCVFLCAFPGPRPWSARSAGVLGLPSPPAA
jgi:hypothetical protein